MTSIKLKPKDGDIRCVDRRVAEMSTTLKNMMTDLEDFGEQVVPLDQISAQVLDKVVQWMTYHSNDPIIAEEESDDESCVKCEEDINTWDKHFYAVDTQLLFDILIAANFLDISDLLRVGCKLAANQLNGKRAEEVWSLWGIECDLDSEEEERLKKENAWTEK